MKRLATVQSILDHMQADGIEEIENLYREALDRATGVLQEILQTGDMDQVTVTDDFYVEPDHPVGPNWAVVLRLSRGLLSAAPTVTYSTTRTGLASSGVSASGLHQATLTKGKVQTYGINLDPNGVYFRAVYTSGFAADGSDADQYDLSTVPEWLQQAARITAILLVDALKPGLRHGADGEGRLQGVGTTATMLKHERTQLLSNHIRYLPDAVSPYVTSTS